MKDSFVSNAHMCSPTSLRKKSYTYSLSPSPAILPGFLFPPSLQFQAYEATPADDAYGFLFLTIRQGAFSRTTVKELSPLDIGTFLGNVGGFWGTLNRGQMDDSIYSSNTAVAVLPFPEQCSMEGAASARGVVIACDSYHVVQ